MNRWRIDSLARGALIALLLAFGLAIGSFVTSPDTGQAATEKVAAQAKVDRIAASRITQEQRDTAAARVKLMQKVTDQLSATGTTGATGRRMAAAMAVPGPGGVPDYFGLTPNWAYSPLLRKFVDTLPGLGPTNANNLGNYIPVAKPDTITYPGSDYYVIELRQYTQQMHSDLPPTTLRGYVQTNKGTDSGGANTLNPDPIHYLGPIIEARKNRPVRVKFTNKLPVGAGGDLFIPVDTSVMGAGMGPDETTMFTQNRATLHLHGGITPWISDGTPHQWITPAGEDTPYPKGVSVKNVPDMPDPGDGSMTFFYSNQQSARMLWYHDHSYGITRLNVYAGEASGYMLTDDTEQELIANGTIPSEQIPLIIQDKTFVDADTILTTDPTWKWGTTAPVPNTGDLWVPHVYVPAQNPALIDGINPTGRWHYGPWFWPPASGVRNPPVPNPYYDPINAPWENELMPATPNPSMGMENYNDTPIVNGTAYPRLDVQPKAYRFRILNAANDRFFNLQMYVADSTVTSSDGRTNTEVKMVPAVPTAGFPELWPVDAREGGAPDPATAGPVWIQIGTESGFLPKPAIIPQQPVTWNMDPTMFNVGNVQDHSLLIGTAERADVVVDFSQYAGKTLILYNDAPTAFPALDPRTDYFTGDADHTDTGGTLSTQPGFGPNTRTVMQIKVAAAAPAAPYDLAALNAAFASTATTQGVFAKSQNPILVPDARYNSAYNDTFKADTYVRIFQNKHTFKTLDSTTVTMPLEPKAIQDEMGETFDPDFGRMSGKLGLELPNTTAGNQNFMLYGFIDRPTEVLNDSLTPLSTIGADGTQLWKITHNGVDTHTIHFHLFDVQLINRVGWDGFIRPPDDNELGWKDTIRVSPLEDTIVALKPVAPKLNFGMPDSIRPLNPAAPLGSTMDFSSLDPLTGQPITPPVTNEMYNFGWEYVWHCHILSHEEMDMMRPIKVNVARSLSATPSLVATGLPGSDVTLSWTDPTPANDPATLGNPANEIGFRVERADRTSDGTVGPFVAIGGAMANQTSFVDTTTVDGRGYQYVVIAFNAAGDTVSNAVNVAPAAYFTSYMITPSAGAGGIIAPATIQYVATGSDSATFTITPSTGYHIADVTVDGVSVGAVAAYKFTNVVFDHTIAATFAINTYTITPSAGANGSVASSAPQTVNHGADSGAFAIAPSIGYHIADVKVDGVSVGAVSTYTFTNVTANHTIAATFAIDTYTITSSAGANGSIAPSAPQTVSHGADSGAFAISPSTGYHIADVRVDGVSVGALSTYTFTNVTANHTISATFAANAKTASLTSINASATTIRYGSTVRLFGYVVPNAQGQQVTIQRYLGAGRWANLTTATLATNSSYTRTISKMSRGTWYFRTVYSGTTTVAGSTSRYVKVVVR